jgi:hypothetical protein
MAIASYSRPPLRMAARVSSAPVSDLGRDDLAGRGAFIAASHNDTGCSAHAPCTCAPLEGAREMLVKSARKFASAPSA